MFDRTLLSRVEDASLNASAPTQQRWLDGWLVRTSPGKAQRARCINALAPGVLPLEDKLTLAEQVYAEAGLPMLVRITPFTQPAGLDAALAERGWTVPETTQVQVCPVLPTAAPPLPRGLDWVALDADAYAEAVGALRGSPPAQRAAHAARLRASPVPYRGFAVTRAGGGPVLCCAQVAVEQSFAGLYDVYTHESVRGQGYAGLVCERLLALAAASGARCGYLQVEDGNAAALRVYARLGFSAGYRYHYRRPPA